MNQRKKSEVWGSFGILALTWANGFMQDSDYLLLKLILEQGQFHVDVKALWQVAQIFMNQSQMNSCLLHLQNSCILKVYINQSQVRNVNYQFHDQARDFSHCTVNENIADHLRLILEENIIPLFKKHSTLIHETKNGLGFLTCRSCTTDYKITELHLKGIKECINHKCRIKTLEPKVPDEILERNVKGLENIIKQIQICISNCFAEEFPTEEYIKQYFTQDNQQNQNNSQESIWDLMGKGDELVKARVFIVAKRKKQFNKQKTIASFIEQKIQLINGNNMQIE